MTKRAYGYIRVSTRSQADSGMGLRAQRRLIVEYHRMHLRSARLVVFADRGVSAVRLDLPHRLRGRAMMEALQAGDHVIVAKMDRAFRSIRDFDATWRQWERRRVHVHILDLGIDTSTSVGRLMASLLASFAEFESRRIGERIREAGAERRRKGLAVNGNPAVGWVKLKNKRVAVDKIERAKARRIALMRRKGMSFRLIAAALNAAGARNRAGRPWLVRSVRRWAASAVAGFPRRGVER